MKTNLTVIEQMARGAGDDLRSSELPKPSYVPYEDKYDDVDNPNWTWEMLDWKSIERRVSRLEKRIFKATKAGQTRKAKKLKHLLMKSSANVLLSIRKATQENKGAKTPGVDGLKYNTGPKRQKLAIMLMKWAKVGFKGYKAKPLSRIYIPKSNGKKRPLGIPTQLDRVMQKIVLNTMEPGEEAIFESCSYGFRGGMSTHDAIGDIFNNCSQKPKTIIDADIEGFFDHISHPFILNLVEDMFRPFVKQWLKAGYIDKSHLHQTGEGTPQGGIISPLLANMVLNNMERDLKAWWKKLVDGDGNRVKNRARIAKEVRVVRYADDFIVAHRLEETAAAEKSIGFIEGWLAYRGLKLSKEKTSIVNTLEGFDFLGKTIRTFENNRLHGYYRQQLESTKVKGKPKKLEQIKKDRARLTRKYNLSITPSRKAEQKHREAIREIFRVGKAWSQDDLISKLNPCLRGWANYHKWTLSSEAFSKADEYLWKKLWKWARWRHPKKGLRWIKKKYFTNTRGRNAGRKWKGRTWDFITKSRQLDWHMKFNEGTGKWVKIQSGRSIYDGDAVYWATRLTKGYGNIPPSKAKILKRQNGRCAYCGAPFQNGDNMETHHIIERCKGGGNSYQNLALLHLHCHDQLHAQIPRRKFGITHRQNFRQENQIGHGNDTETKKKTKPQGVVGKTVQVALKWLGVRSPQNQ